MMNNLKRLREEQSLSIEFIARMLEISVEKYKDYENQDNIESELLEKMAKLFGVEKTDILSNHSSDTLGASSLVFSSSNSDITAKDKKAIEILLNLKRVLS